MFHRTLQVRLDKATFPTGVPGYLKSGSQNIDIRQALMMLGNFTIPNGLSVASPAIYWAWIRYFSAISVHSSLQITKPFGDLDPHLKSVLSDDFGVAMTMQWLSDCVKGFKQVVGGRLFILNYAHLLKHVPPVAKKVGPQKSPDFVVLDAANRWHVIECKGNQSSPAHSTQQLKRARQQKGAVDIKTTSKGSSLAAALYLASERSGNPSRIVVQDPENPEPLIRVESADLAQRAACRVTTARCFGLAGMPQLAYEAAFAETNDTRLQDLFSEYERTRGQPSISTFHHCKFKSSPRRIPVLRASTTIGRTWSMNSAVRCGKGAMPRISRQRLITTHAVTAQLLLAREERVAQLLLLGIAQIARPARPIAPEGLDLGEGVLVDHLPQHRLRDQRARSRCRFQLTVTGAIPVAICRLRR